MTERPLIVGIDGSPEAREAVRWAAGLAVRRGCNIIAVHALGLPGSLDGQVVTADNDRSEIEALVRRQWYKELPPNGTTVRATVCDGDPVGVLVEMAVREAAAMVIVGRQGTGHAPALALGRSSDRLVQQSPVPLLVVPDPGHAARHLALHRIVVAIDGSPACTSAIDTACDLAALFEARVELVRAVGEVPVLRRGHATRATIVHAWAAPARARLDAEIYCQQVRDHGVPVHMTVERGEPDEVVGRVASRLHADLIVAATQWAGLPSEAPLDSVSCRIVHVAHRPTLIVPMAKPDVHRTGWGWVDLGTTATAAPETVPYAARA